MEISAILLSSLRLFQLAARLLAEGRSEATAEEILAVTQRMDDADARLEQVLRQAEEAESPDP